MTDIFFSTKYFTKSKHLKRNFLFEVICEGTEANLGDCEYSRQANCYTTEAVELHCSMSKLLQKNVLKQGGEEVHMKNLQILSKIESLF